MLRTELDSHQTCTPDITCKSGRRTFLRRLAFGISALASCAKPAALPPHLFACEQRDLTGIATRFAGHEMNPDEIQRSSSGDHIRIVVSGRASERRILVVSLNRPPVVLAPGAAHFWALADDLTVVAWGEDAKAGTYFRNGFVQEIPYLAVVRFAPGSLYYCVASGPSNLTSVYATEKPGVLMTQVGFVVQEIFWSHERLYLFGWNRDSKELEIVGRVFRNDSGVLTRESDIRIRAPRSAANFFALDLDPHSDLLLCGDTRDELGAEWFIYNLRSRALTDVGKSHPFGVFLQDDLIKLLRSS